jgi:hypothetical protein
LSLPDMHKLKTAVALREDIGDTEIPYGKLQVCNLALMLKLAWIC